MALIGTISISMTAQTAALTKGFKDAAAAVDKFGSYVGGRFASIFAPIGAAIAATGSSIAYAFSPIKGLIDYTTNWGKALGVVFGGPIWAGVKGFGKYLGTWKSALAEVYSGSKLEHFVGSFGKVASVVGSAIPRVWSLSKGFAGLVGAGAIKGLSLAASGMVAIERAVSQAVTQLAKFGAVASTVVGYGLLHISKGAGALAEQTDRARIDFGEFAGLVVDQSKLMATAFGISRKEFIASASAFAPVFQGAKYAQKNVAALSLAMTKLAIDLSSKVDIPVEEAMAKLQSGLAGEVEPLRRLGLSMTVANVEAYAYSKGIAKLGAELTEGQKVQARAGYIFENSKKTLGNLTATSEGYGNITRSLAGRIENLSDTVGTAFNTIIGPAISDLAVGIHALQMAWDASAFSALSATSGVVGATQVQAQSIGVVQKAIGFIADSWQYVSMGFTSFQSVLLFGLSKVLSGLQSFNDALVSVLDTMGVGHGKANTFFGDMAKDLEKSAFQALDVFDAKKMAPAFSDAINQAFADARSNIADVRKELAKPGVDVTKLTPAAEAKKGGDAIKLASAESTNSQEGVNTLLKSRYGAGQATTSKPAEATAKNTAKTNDLLGQLVGILKGGSSIPEQSGQAIGTLLGNF